MDNNTFIAIILVYYIIDVFLYNETHFLQFNEINHSHKPNNIREADCVICNRMIDWLASVSSRLKTSQL